MFIDEPHIPACDCRRCTPAAPRTFRQGSVHSGSAPLRDPGNDSRAAGNDARRSARRSSMRAGSIRGSMAVAARTKELCSTRPVLISCAHAGGGWDRFFTATACSNPNAHALALPRKMCCSPTANVDRLTPIFESADGTGPPCRARSLTRGRRASTGRSCYSTAGWSGGLPGTSYDGGAMPRRRILAQG